MHQALVDLWFGFGVAFEPHNLMWSFFGVLVGNLIGVLPGMGALSAISILLPLTYVMHPVPAILMLAGIFYGSQYGGAIGAILLNLPSHPPHAVTCLDGYPLTKQGKGGTALGITMIASFFAASVGILVMIFSSPLLVEVAFKFGPTEIFSIMLLGLLAGSTMSRGSPLKGVCHDAVRPAVRRGRHGRQHRHHPPVVRHPGLVRRPGTGRHRHGPVRRRRLPDQREPHDHYRHRQPSCVCAICGRAWRRSSRQAFLPLVRGTLVGTVFGAMPGTGPTITTFIAYALERKISKTPETLRHRHDGRRGVARGGSRTRRPRSTSSRP